MNDNHTCGIDCKVIDYGNGNVAHQMYPATPNGAAGRYQAALNLGMDRRAYRASGQFPTRNVRVWDAARAARKAAGE